MPGQYDHRVIEPKWQKIWHQKKVYSDIKKTGGRSTYVLDMFPYPSGGGLHVGHPEGYTASDIVSRYFRMKGLNVLHPMGWDAFGLPAENAAIKKKTHPRIVTEQNIGNFKRQIQAIGFSYDWDREVNTTDPKYYKWTQWIFLQLFKKGLAYEAELPIWWCPKDKTGLANEEVVNGNCDRCGTAVERKLLRQWVLKITEYAERLLSGLEKLDWPESIKSLQRNWIGKSEGAEVKFQIPSTNSQTNSNAKSPKHDVWVFTTRPDTLFGATYLVLSPEHPLVDQITVPEYKQTVLKYKKEVASKSDLERTALEKEKTGVFTGAYAINPVNNEKIPVWIADYVLMSYGTGAIMAVPAHDERDREFALKHGLEIREVIEPIIVHSKTKTHPELKANRSAFIGEGKLINSGKYTGLASDGELGARGAIVKDLKNKGNANPKTNYKLRDWVFSRQRYWGEPIPLVKCENCKLKVESTPHYLNFYNETTWQNLLSGKKTIETRALNPEEPDRYFGKISSGHAQPGNYFKGVFKPTGATAYFRIKSVRTYKSLKQLWEDKKTLAAVAPDKRFKTVKELEVAYNRLAPGYAEKIRKNGLIAFEVKHVLPGIILDRPEDLPILLPEVEKYEPTGTGESPLAAVKDWVNVTCRVCGHPARRETNTMPQWAGSCWYYIRFCDPHNAKAMAGDAAMKAWLPVDVYVGGAEHAVLHLLYARFWHKVLFDIGAIPKEVGDEPFIKLKNQGLILGPDGEKMSKSRGNVINPDEIIEKYGADTLRMYEMFMGPFEDAKPWDTNGIVGVRRFLDRVYKLVSSLADSSLVDGLPNRAHKYIKLITEGIENFRFNTCVSDLMKWVNEIGADKASRDEFGVFLKILSPFAPHMAEELWSKLGNKTLLVQETWPKFDPAKIKKETVTIAVQVNGKHRGNITVPTGTDEKMVREVAEAEPNVKKYLTTEPKTVIYVTDRLINFVI